MKLLRLHLVLVSGLLFFLLCTIVSLSLFSRIIQVPIDNPSWPGILSSTFTTSSESSKVDSPEGASRESIQDGVDRDDETRTLRRLAEKESEVRSLLEERTRLKQELQGLRARIANLSSQHEGRIPTNSNGNTEFLDEPKFIDCLSESVRNLNIDESKLIGRFKSRRFDFAANRSRGDRPINEHDAVAFTRFNAMKMYSVESGFERHVVEKPTGHRKAAIETAIEFSQDGLNDQKLPRSRKNGHAGPEFLEGIYRTVPGVGEQYELYFSDRDLPQYNRLTVARFLSNPIVLARKTIPIRKDLVYMIVPLSGRVDNFRKFMERFVQVAILSDNKVYLMVIYFGEEGLDEVEAIVRKIAISYHYKDMRVLALRGKFSRGKALREGAKRCPISGDVLMFFCDVDIIITTDFLERCRVNTERGKRVYYPIVFSLYNPSIVSAFAEPTLRTANNNNDALVLSDDTGFWRDFGYGMICHFRSDFLKLNGFNETISGWGLEDLFLYRKYLRSDLTVVRATDPGIVHLWHEKTCDVALAPDQYRSCLRSKALNEASHAQLGMMTFGTKPPNNRRNATGEKRPQ